MAGHPTCGLGLPGSSVGRNRRSEGSAREEKCSGYKTGQMEGVRETRASLGLHKWDGIRMA